MTQAKPRPLDLDKPLSFEEFLEWDAGTDELFELIDGIPVPTSDPNANHEDVADKLYRVLEDYSLDNDLPYAPKRSKLVYINNKKSEKGANSRRADIVVFDLAKWEELKSSPSSAAAYETPPMIIEVVSTNADDDYNHKLEDYEALGVPEYWIVDYLALGNAEYTGRPKLPTVSVYLLVNKKYQVKRFKGGEVIESQTFPDLKITANQVLTTDRKRRNRTL